jgi:AraC-like DNA-binding protein
MIRPCFVRPQRFWASRVSPQLNTLWRGNWPAGYVEPARYLYDHELVIVTEGSCVIAIGREQHELSADDYIIVPPGLRHVTTTQRGVYRNCIHFDWMTDSSQQPHPVCSFYPKQPAKNAIKSCPDFIPRRLFRGRYSTGSAVAPLVETLFHRWQSGDRFEQSRSRATFLELLLLLMKPVQKRQPARRLDHAQAVRDLIDQRGESTESIQSLLETLGFSYAHLCRLFRATFGITPVEYRNAQRLERAKQLLLDPKLTIAEVGYAVGFNDPGYFTRQFQRQNGMSPRELRRRIDA